jgi:hypothetical protein
MEKEYLFLSDKLVRWRPLGVLNTQKIFEFINYVDQSAEERDPHFDRYIDLSKVSGVSVMYDDLSPIAKARKTYYSSHISRKVKMAFFANNPLTFGMARMYQTLSEDENLDIRIFKSIDEVASYLQIDKKSIAK